jgi:hypothetical protein
MTRVLVYGQPGPAPGDPETQAVPWAHVPNQGDTSDMMMAELRDIAGRRAHRRFKEMSVRAQIRRYGRTTCRPSARLATPWRWDRLAQPHSHRHRRRRHNVGVMARGRVRGMKGCRP